MKFLDLNRYTSNYLQWTFTLREFCKKMQDDRLIPSIAHCLIESKQYLPEEALEKSGLSKFNDETELMESNEFGKICLYFANSSIFSTFVALNGNEIVYDSHIDNTNLFYILLFADYVVNVYTLQNTVENPIRVKIHFDKKLDNDAFAYLMDSAFKQYFPDVTLEMS